MNVACDLTQLRSAVKADLFSRAIAVLGGIYLIDPILLAKDHLAGLANIGSTAGIVMTNSNHQRASIDYADKFSAHRDCALGKDRPRSVEVADGTKIGDELEVIEIGGAAAGEIALYHAANSGTIIVGDALINFEPYGFTFLPRKYCTDEKEMRRSLRKPLTRKAERLLFAHGAPIFAGARARLQQLLDGDF